MWWEVSNRLLLVDFKSKDNPAKNADSQGSLKVQGSWVLPDDIMCSHTCNESHLIAFGLRSGKSLIWDMEQGKTSERFTSIYLSPWLFIDQFSVRNK